MLNVGVDVAVGPQPHAADRPPSQAPRAPPHPPCLCAPPHAPLWWTASRASGRLTRCPPSGRCAPSGRLATDDPDVPSGGWVTSGRRLRGALLKRSRYPRAYQLAEAALTAADRTAVAEDLSACVAATHTVAAHVLEMLHDLGLHDTRRL